MFTSVWILNVDKIHEFQLFRNLVQVFYYFCYYHNKLFTNKYYKYTKNYYKCYKIKSGVSSSSIYIILELSVSMLFHKTYNL